MTDQVDVVAGSTHRLRSVAAGAYKRALGQGRSAQEALAASIRITLTERPDWTQADAQRHFEVMVRPRL
jgi:hypothetical protein